NHSLWPPTAQADVSARLLLSRIKSEKTPPIAIQRATIEIGKESLPAHAIARLEVVFTLAWKSAHGHTEPL
ncbi:MAG: hypothetical protein AAB262_07775, partial [Elusimicrobiota bacterium]